jgi:uncharacterized protein YlxP (DUF503 family)
MVVSMIQFIIEIPATATIKDKRRAVNSLKDRVRNRFKVSISEVDLQESHRFAHLGVALVSNSRQYGESVMHKILSFLEENVSGRLIDAKIASEFF